MMDETMAIERILSGNGITTWSQVSKKKKHPQSRATNQGPHTSEFDRSRDHRNDNRSRRDRSTLQHQNNEQSNTLSNGHRKPGGPPRRLQSSRGKDHNSGRPTRARAPNSKSPDEAQKPSRAHKHHSTTSEDVANTDLASHLDSSVNLTKDKTGTWGSPPHESHHQDKANTLSSSSEQARSDSKVPHTWGNAPAVSNAGGRILSPGSPQASLPSQPNAWAGKDKLDSRDVTVDNAGKPDLRNARDSAHSAEAHQKSPIKSTQKVLPPTLKRTFNYAAAAAAGTSHEKPAVKNVPSQAKPSLKSSSVENEVSSEKTEDVHFSNVIESGRASSALPSPGDHSTIVDSERDLGADVELNVPGPVTSSVSIPSPVPSVASTAKEPSPKSNAPSATVTALGSPASSTGGSGVGTPIRSNAWQSRPNVSPVTEDKSLIKPSTIMPATPSGISTSEATQDSLISLQFGSFGLGGLDGHWSPKPKSIKPVGNSIGSALKVNASVGSAKAEPVSNPSSAHASVPTDKSSRNSATPTASSVAVPSVTLAGSSPSAPSGLGVGTLQQGRGQESNTVLSNNASDPRVSALSSSLHLPNVSSGGSGSTIFPVMAMPGPGANFAPANYGPPYLMPPLHGYSPALGSYGESSSDLNSSRGPSLPSGSLPLYDPNLSVMGSGNGKFGMIPGLGDVSALGGMQTGVGKDGMQGNVDMEKGNALGVPGLGNAMDPLATPYMLPGYASMQYPMYPFPTAHFGPHGIAPPGPGPFPYPAAASQVSSQGGRGFGFDDGVGISGNARNGSGLTESMYTPGGYLANGSHKGGPDGSYKPGRGNNGGFGGMGMSMGSGMVMGMGYGDYSGVMGGSGNNAVGGGSWSHRPVNGGRGDGNVNNVMMSNGMLGNNVASGPGGGYGGGAASGGPGPGNGAGDGYWTGQAGGYYS